MSGRHRPKLADRIRWPGRIPLIIVAVTILAAGTTVVVQSFANAGGCSHDDGVVLSIAADPAIAPALREIAAEWSGDEQPEVDGRCVAVEVTATPTADVAGALAARSGGFLDVAATPAPTLDPDDGPAVWVPDSSYWLTRVLAVDRNLFEPHPLSLAVSPVVLAVSVAGAELLGAGPLTPTELTATLLDQVDDSAAGPSPVRLTEPRRDTAGLVGAYWLRTAATTAGNELPQVVGVYRTLGDTETDSARLLDSVGAEATAAPVSEQALITHNEAASTTITAVPVVDAAVLDFPYALLSRQPRAVQTAATLFRTAAAEATEVLTRHGFRNPDGIAGTGFPIGRGVTATPVPVLPVGPPEQVAEVLRIWTSARSHARVLALVDVTASMRNTMTRASDGAALSRLQVLQEASVHGLRLFTEETDLGVWVYATGLEAEQDWVETVPIGTLTPERQQLIEDEIHRLRPTAASESALFEALLAGYQELKDGYDPTRSNTLILWTDGTSDKPDGLALSETLSELERLADLTRPIRVVLLGLGPDVNMEQLTEIARVTGGAAFQVEDPDEVSAIFLQALLT